MIAENNSAMVWWWSRFNALLFEEDAEHFHQHCKTACATQSEFYPKYKNNVTPISGTHRNEVRGIGDCSSIIAKLTEK
jgi:coproporphyrinogen III oxidase